MAMKLMFLIINKQELSWLIAETLVHEVAHHVGIDDDRLDELGWG